ncbi:MAG: transcriptional regulator BetI [Ketobacteraceae bacterium]|nr:transcriptional regulator BetI [Ketobacteraceae bacterium]
MPKLGMQEVRRRQLIEATIATIERHGFAETTIAGISQAAGLSSGIISHYFGGKNALLAASMRSLLRELQAVTIVRLRQARTPTERVAAIVAANFAPEQFTPRVCAAWLAFYAQVPWSPELARLHRVYVRRLRSNLAHAYRQCLPATEAERAAEGMSALIDGIYVRAALRGEAADIHQAYSLANDYLHMTLDYYGRQATGHPARTAGGP